MTGTVIIGPGPDEKTSLFSEVLACKASLPLVLSDREIAIRQFERRDLPALYEATIESLAGLCAWMNWCRNEYSMDDCRRFLEEAVTAWERGSEYNFAIVDRKQDLLYGSIALNRIDRSQHSANVGYWVRRTCAGRGVASRALRLIAHIGFTDLGLERLEMIIPEENIASCRVAEKAGARVEALPAREVILNGTACKANVYLLEPKPDGA